MKAVVAAFNQEKALVGAFSVIVQLHRLIDLRHYPGPPRHQLLLGRVLVELEEDEGEGGDHDDGGHDEHADRGVPHPGVLDIITLWRL